MLDTFLDKTLLGFTSLGYRWRYRPEWDALPDLSERCLAITGATGGLGEATALGLAARHANLVLIGRDPERLAATADRAMRAGATSVRTKRCDLSLMSRIGELGHELRDEGGIDVLVNNVGILNRSRIETAEGVESAFAVNLLGHYLLTELLLPSLEKRDDARVVNVSSGGMYTQRILPSDPETRHLPYNGPQAYARTKRGQLILTRYWAGRHPAVGVYAMHPGWADTEGVRQALPVFRRLTAPLLRNAAEGADTALWLAAARDLPPAAQAGFFHDRRVRPEHRRDATRETAAERDELISVLERYLQRLLGPAWRE